LSSLHPVQIMIRVLFAHINISWHILYFHSHMENKMAYLSECPKWSRNCNVTTQCGLNKDNTAQLLSISVIAGWSIYEGLLTNILQTQKMEKKRKKEIVCSCL